MAKRIPQNKIDEIYAAIDIVDIVSDFLQLKKRGSNFFALSPWSNEKTPSMAISPTKNIFKDFSSQKGGNGITFLMEAEGMSYVEALTYVAKKYGIDLEFEESEEEKGIKDKRESLFILNEFAARNFHENLFEHEKGRVYALSYLKERGLLEDTIRTFKLGYAIDEWDAFTKEAIKKQYKEDYLTETGLSIRSEKRGTLFDRFKGRLMFPIHDHMGKVLGFGGRILGKQENAAKYVNSPESSIYHKSQVLYGIHFARQSVRDQDQCVLVEGYMDVISLYQNGIKNVVAASGTALTEDQIRLIRRFTKNVLLIFDSDRAGIKAALRGIDLLIEQDMAVKVMLLPEGEDPDSYVKAKGKEGFESEIKEKSQDFIEFKLSYLHTELDPSDPTQKTQIIYEVADTLARIGDQVKQSIYIQFSAEKLHVNQEIVEEAVRKALRTKMKQTERRERIEGRKNEREENQTPISASLTELYPQEKELIRIVLNHAEDEIEIEEEKMLLVEYFYHELEDLVFENPEFERIREQIIQNYLKSGNIDLHKLLQHPDELIRKSVEQCLTIPYEISLNWEKFEIKAPQIDADISRVINDAIVYYKLFKVKKLLKETREKIRTSETPEEQNELTTKYLHLLEMRMEIENTMDIQGGMDANITK